MSDVGSKTDIRRPCTFAVDDVVPAETTIWEEPLLAQVKKRFERHAIALLGEDRPVTNTSMDFYLNRQWPPGSPPALEPSRLPANLRNTVSRSHPLIDAVGTAFAQHRPLTLSPDCIWMAIEQGFSSHITEHAEKFRSRLVRHEGEDELTTSVENLRPQSLKAAIADFSSQIRDRTDHVLHESLICDFSTTTPEVRTASQIVLMDCYSAYFEYSMLSICGIPKVTLTGTLADWRKIRARLEILETFELSWWVSRLRPILDEFIRTVEGTPSMEFWKAIYKPEQAYGATVVTGWIADLFPYLTLPPGRRRSMLFDIPRVDWAVPIRNGITTHFGGGKRSAQGVAIETFPSGLSSVPVKFKPQGGGVETFDLLAGFVAVEQDFVDLSLSPVISWFFSRLLPAKSVPAGAS